MKTVWHNLTVDEQIAKLRTDIAALSLRYQEAKANYEKCASKGALYNCRSNTGKTQSTWYDTMKDQERLMRVYETELARLTGLQISTVESLKQQAALSVQTSAAEQAAAQASGTKALAVGKWVFIGIGALGLLTFMYFKFHKRK